MRAMATVIALLGALSACQVQPTPSRGVRAPDLACRVNTDCVVFDDDIAGAHACCPGCTQRAANRVDVERFRRECASRQPDFCPPLGCVQPPVHAVCRAGRCAIAPGAASPPPHPSPSPAPR